MVESCDLADLKRRLNCAGVAHHYGVKLQRQGRQFVGLCPFHSEGTPSFGIDAHRGLFHCFGCGAGGDVIELVRRFEQTPDFPATVARAAELAGLVPGKPRARNPYTIAPRLVDEAALARQDAEGRERTRRLAYDIWRETLPAAGTPAAAYLEFRGIDLDILGGIPATLRYHPALHHGELNARLPALVGAVRYHDGRFAGIHRTYLRHDGRGKAVCSSPKRMLGPCWTGAIRLAPLTGDIVCLAEGIETGLIAQMCFVLAQRHGLTSEAWPVWAALSLGNIAGGGLIEGAKPHPRRPGMTLPSTVPDPEKPGIILPPQITRVILALDDDNRDPESAAAIYDRAAARFQAEGRKIITRVKPPEGHDYNSWAEALLADPVGARS